MLISEEKKTLDFKAKAPISIFLDDERADYKPGCCILEIAFNDPVTINEIFFRNSYTAFISLSCKKVATEKDVKNRDILPWQASIKKFVLMENPDCDSRSQDNFSIPAKESIVPLIGVVNLRLVLKQPSFKWKRFNLEELTFYGEPTKDVKQGTTYPLSASRRTPELKAPIVEDKTGVALPQKARYMIGISELLRDKQATGNAVGRFEVDGSYDIGQLI